MKNQSKLYLPRVELRVQQTGDTRTAVGLLPYNSVTDMGGWLEVIRPGAFASALTPDADILALRDHTASLLLGRTKSGTLRLTDTSQGLRFEIDLPNSPTGDDVAEALRRQDISGCSFLFVDNQPTWEETQDGRLLRSLVSVSIGEISVCSWPAYEDSEATLRSVPAHLRSKLKERRSNENGCDCTCSECRDGNCDECEMDDCEDFECAEHGCPAQDDDDEWRSRTLFLLNVMQRQ